MGQGVRRADIETCVVAYESIASRYVQLNFEHFTAGNDVLVSESEDELLHRKVFKYIVRKEGNYEVSLLSKGQHVGESPYKVCSLMRNSFRGNQA